MGMFDYFIERVLTHEGGYVNDPRDPGQETRWGISKRSYPAVDIRNLTRAQAIDIYRRDFWQRVRGDELPREFAFQALDAAVNHGIGNAVRWMQRAAGVADDGVIGPVTLAAVQRAQPADAGRDEQGVQQGAQAGHGQGVIAPDSLGEDKGVLRAYGEDKARAHAHALPVCRGDVHGHFV